MLTLEPPFYEIEGVVVYRDHAVPTQYYYAAPQPRIASSGGRLMFDVMAYSVDLKHSVLSGTTIPEELGAGFLNMGVECALTDNQRSTLLRHLEELAGVPESQISLYPIPYQKGSVSVLALDQFTVPGQPPADPASPSPLKGRPTFVEKVLGNGQPSLLGDLRSIFSLSLSQEGVTFLEGLYEDHAAPVGVVYDLKFYGLRPAVEARVKANLSRIYQHFGGGLAGQYSWFKADIQAGLDYLREQSAIEVQLTSQATGAEADKSKELAMSLFRDRIVQEMFRPTSPAPSTAALPGAISSSLPASSSPSGSTSSGVSTNLIALTLQYRRSEELKEVVYDFREVAPEERSHSPQGFLPVLLSPAELEQRVHRISLDSSFFELLEVLVTGPAKDEFEALGIRQVEVTLTYGETGDSVPPESRSLLFRPDSTGDKTFAVKRRGRPSLAYTAAIVYEFTRTRGTDGDSFRYELPPRKLTGRSLSINPYADFGVLDVEIEPGRIDPDARQIDVHLAYSSGSNSGSNGFSADEHFRLVMGETPPPGARHWQVRTRNTEIRPYTAVYTLVFEDGAYETKPITLTDRLLRVDTPFKGRRELLIKPNPTSDQITQITVELEYKDEANGYQRSKLVRLEPPFASVQQSWPILDLDQQTVRYRVTVQEPGMLTEGEWKETTDPSIIVGSDNHREAKVQLQLIGPSLNEVGLDALQIKIALALPQAPMEEPMSVLLQSGETKAEVKLILPPGATLRYRYQTIAFKMDGTVTESDWKEMTSASLIISTRRL